jgi:hypothetical protein
VKNKVLVNFGVLILLDESTAVIVIDCCPAQLQQWVMCWVGENKQGTAIVGTMNPISISILLHELCLLSLRNLNLSSATTPFPIFQPKCTMCNLLFSKLKNWQSKLHNFLSEAPLLLFKSSSA